VNDEAIDLKEVLERVQDDRDLLLELLDIFLTDCPPKIEAMKRAVGSKDLTQLRDLSHSLKGASGNISAKKMYAAFLKIEQMAKNNDLNQIETLLKEIDTQLIDVRGYALKLKKDFKKTP
jgi:two-component system, sensor histidine kinase and response regulator